MKHPLPLLRRAVLALVLVAVLPLATVRAQDPAATPAASEDATPAPTPRPRPRPKPTPDASLPVGTVNGTAIYRPLMKSIVADPIDRALLIYDYNKHAGKLSEAQVDEAVRAFKRDRFSNNEASLNAKLAELGATPDDLRRFVAEETKLRLELANITRTSISDESARRAQGAYIAGLRRNATINAPKR